MNLKKGMTFLALVAAMAVPAFAADEVAEATEQETTGGWNVNKSYGYTALMVGVGTPFALPWDFDWDLFGIGVNIGYTDVNKMYGLEVAGGANTARLDMKGLQAAALFNYANRDAYGMQAAIVNIGHGDSYGFAADAVGFANDFYGLRADLLGARLAKSFYGLEIAGIGSMVDDDMWGMQAAICANYAQRVHGLQAAIGFNMTQELRGAQVGLVNWATTCSAGFQVGLVNIISDNQIPFIPFVNAYF